MNRTLGIKRWVLIEAGPEVVFDYLTNLSSHEQWEEYSGFAVVEISPGPVVRGSCCRRERIENYARNRVSQIMDCTAGRGYSVLVVSVLAGQWPIEEN